MVFALELLGDLVDDLDAQQADALVDRGELSGLGFEIGQRREDLARGDESALTHAGDQAGDVTTTLTVGSRHACSALGACGIVVGARRNIGAGDRDGRALLRHLARSFVTLEVVRRLVLRHVTPASERPTTQGSNSPA